MAMNYYFVNDPVAQKAAREARKARLADIALENTPANVCVIEIRKGLTGRACYASGKLSAPRPFTRKALYIFLHECAHFALHADGKRRRRYMEEMEAEQWAHARMREAGIPVPRQMTRRAKAYVRRKLRQAFMRGATSFDSRALRFTGSRQIGTVKS
jgi:hypothetical protein